MVPLVREEAGLAGKPALLWAHASAIVCYIKPHLRPLGRRGPQRLLVTGAGLLVPYARHHLGKLFRRGSRAGGREAPRRGATSLTTSGCSRDFSALVSASARRRGVRLTLGGERLVEQPTRSSHSVLRGKRCPCSAPPRIPRNRDSGTRRQPQVPPLGRRQTAFFLSFARTGLE